MKGLNETNISLACHGLCAMSAIACDHIISITRYHIKSTKITWRPDKFFNGLRLTIQVWMLINKAFDDREREFFLFKKLKSSTIIAPQSIPAKELTHLLLKKGKI